MLKMTMNLGSTVYRYANLLSLNKIYLQHLGMDWERDYLFLINFYMYAILYLSKGWCGFKCYECRPLVFMKYLEGRSQPKSQVAQFIIDSIVLVKVATFCLISDLKLISNEFLTRTS